VVLLPGELSLLACAFCYPWSSGSQGSCSPRGTGFPGFRVKVAGHALGESVWLRVPVCAEKWDFTHFLILTDEYWSLEPHGIFRGGGSGVLSCELFFPFFPWLVISLLVDL
jgi:hypothetical protein